MAKKQPVQGDFGFGSTETADVGESGAPLEVTLDDTALQVTIAWLSPESGQEKRRIQIQVIRSDELRWYFRLDSPGKEDETSWHRMAIRARMKAINRTSPVPDWDRVRVHQIEWNGKTKTKRQLSSDELFDEFPVLQWLENQIVRMTRMYTQWMQESVLQGMANRARQRQESQRRSEQRQKSGPVPSFYRKPEPSPKKAPALKKTASSKKSAKQDKSAGSKEKNKESGETAQAPAEEIAKMPVPEIPVHVHPPEVNPDELNDLTTLSDYFLLEKASRWWVSNQSDDLLALPYCDVEQLEYQVRTALRVIGPLRGRALLSDEVGLGKTIEAGLVLKEYLTRGMVERFLVLTVPSLVDQWQEELRTKFDLSTATTNDSGVRNDLGQFWRENQGIVASLHTLKQPRHVKIAQECNWDLLIVDEAHYLRNRSSQAWKAINSLPRQFLLLLTATPVQNSLEELYNLVTLLQPGQLPSPQEFRNRFIDPKNPHQPKAPEELRRLLGQVMIRNTRANAGIELPSRRSETVQFEPDVRERDFWTKWEPELRESLGRLSSNQSSLWGRLLLQASGSSPSAWEACLNSYPEQELAAKWKREVPESGSWRQKCDALPPLARGEGGVVVFTQFVKTQLAISEYLKEQNVPVRVINGQTPPEERQPITENFRREGGVLLLTRSGTEGRNLQFCHRLVNFDLPWNPMEIEQRIGRLHRLGQQHTVRIYNFVTSRSLQEQILTILQEKLNLFELVVGETGLILGDRFSSDDFADEVFRRWQDSPDSVDQALDELGDELAAARNRYFEVKELDDTLFSHDYEEL